jgi:hypothetical protein
MRLVLAPLHGYSTRCPHLPTRVQAAPLPATATGDRVMAPHSPTAPPDSRREHRPQRTRRPRGGTQRTHQWEGRGPYVCGSENQKSASETAIRDTDGGDTGESSAIKGSVVAAPGVSTQVPVSTAPGVLPGPAEDSALPYMPPELKEEIIELLAEILVRDILDDESQEHAEGQPDRAGHGGSARGHATPSSDDGNDEDADRNDDHPGAVAPARRPK